MRFPFIILKPSILIKSNKPQNLQISDKDYFITTSDLILPPIKLFSLKNISVLSDGYIFKGLTTLRDSYVLTDKGYLETLNWKGLLPIVLKSHRKRLYSQTSYLIIHNFFSGYFHWVAESLPRLFLVKDIWKNTKILLPDSYKASFYLETLKLLGIENVEYLKKNVVYKIPHLIFPTVTAQQQSYRPELIREVSGFFLNATADTLSPIQNKKIYVSRANAERRKIINEAAVVAVLTLNGFTSVILEDFTFAQQVQICHQAEVLISIHGAGLTNIMFMRPKSKVLELRKHDNGAMNYYYNLASVAELQYFYQFCTSDKPELSVMYADIYVDIEELKNNLQLMGI